MTPSPKVEAVMQAARDYAYAVGVFETQAAIDQKQAKLRALVEVLAVDAEPVAWRWRETKDERWRFTRHNPENLARQPHFIEPLFAARTTQNAKDGG